MRDVEIVNIAASGDLGRELDIERLAEDADTPVASYDPDFHATFFRFDEGASELVIVYRSGKYIVRGGDTHEKLERTHRRFLELLDRLDIDVSEPEFEVKNVVCVGDLGFDVDLNRTVVVLGLEVTEYEPEQFPGLVYRPEDSKCVLLIFASGKVVITGGRSREDAEGALERLVERLDRPQPN